MNSLPLYIANERPFIKLYNHYMENTPPRGGSSFYNAFWKGYDGIPFDKTGFVRYTFAHVAWRAGKDKARKEK